VIGGVSGGTLLLARTVPRPPSPVLYTRLWASGLLSREEQQALENAVSPVKLVGPHTDLAREGEGADLLSIIVDGWACRYTTTKEGSRQLSALLLPGDVGNLDTLMFDRLDYGVRTITEAKLVTLPRKHASALAAQHAGIARGFMWLGLVENAILSRWGMSLGRRSAGERLAHLLCELSVRVGAENDGESRFSFPLTQEQLADALGLTAVHVNRTIRQLRNDGLIELENRTLTIPNVAKLRQASGFDPRYLHIAVPDDAQFAAFGG
jgi:CRP-like cAMP-binding protein